MTTGGRRGEALTEDDLTGDEDDEETTPAAADKFVAAATAPSEPPDAAAAALELVDDEGLMNFCQLLSSLLAFLWTSGSSVDRRS